MTSVMRPLASVIASTLIGVVAIAATGSTSLAEDNTAVAPDKACEWRGTAPLCEGGCEPGEVADEVSADADSARNFPDLFGASCFSGFKVFCCRLSCPGGLTLVAKRCVPIDPMDYGGGQAKQTDVLVPEQSSGPSPFGAAQPFEERKNDNVTAKPPPAAIEMKKGLPIKSP